MNSFRAIAPVRFLAALEFRLLELSLAALLVMKGLDDCADHDG